MDHWKRSGWTITGLAFVAGFCAVMNWRYADSGADVPSPEDQSLDLLASPNSDGGPGSALIAPRIGGATQGDGWGQDRPSDATGYRATVQAVPRNLKAMGEEPEPEHAIRPPEPKLRDRGGEQGPMATFLGSTATSGLVGPMVRSIALGGI